MKKQNPKNKKARIEHSAGGVAFRRGARGIEIGLIMDPFRKWTFPKGHLDAGERVEEAALRETGEEMGLHGLKLVVPLGSTSIWFRDRFVHKGELIHKFIDYFLVEAPANIKAVPQKNEKIRAVRWVPYRRAPQMVSYKNMMKVVRNAVAYLDKMRSTKFEIRNKSKIQNPNISDILT